MKNRFPSSARRSLTAQEIYFAERRTTQHSLGMTLFCAGLLLTTFSACFLPVVSRAAVSEMAAPVTSTTPNSNRRVFQQGLPTYHWHHDCPLTNSTSQRKSGDAAKKRIYI